MVGAAAPHLARHVKSIEGFAWDTDDTLAWMAWMTASSTPSVALIVSRGSFVKKASATVLVPGSEEGKEARNCAGSHCRFCAKWINPANQV